MDRPNKKTIPGGVKDEYGQYTVLPKSQPTPPIPTEQPKPKDEIVDEDISIDDMYKKILNDVNRILRNLRTEVTGGSISREVIMGYKDVAAILADLYKKQREFLNTLSDEDLEKLVK